MAVPTQDEGSRPGAEEAARIRAVMAKIAAGLEARGEDPRPQAMGRRFGCAAVTVKKRYSGERRLPREFVEAAAQAAGLRTVDLYLDLGWLPAEEVLAPEAGSTAQLVNQLATTMVRLSDRLSGAQPSRRTALHAAVYALLTSPTGRSRYRVTLSVVESGDRYRIPTYTVAEFKLREEAEPLPLARAVDLAAAQGIAAPERSPAPEDAGHLAERLELRALTEAARRNGDETTWQGDPNTKTWRTAAERWPAHLLVQSALTGASAAGAAAPWSPREPHPLVVIGAGYGAGTAAALLAEALGWQFVFVHNGMTVTSRGEVMAIERSWPSGRTLAWTEVARHIAERTPVDPWRAVVLVRPQSFAGAQPADERGALEALRTTNARVVYARPPAPYLDWWAARQQGMTAEPDAAFDGPRWHRERSLLLERIEATLAERRPAHRDLRIELPLPDGPLDPHTPHLPAEVMDHQARTAWAVLDWLNTEVNTGLPRLADHLRPSLLAGLRTSLAADPVRIKAL
ncbi:hypothetical protein KDK95_26285 [Actinospica sp. MGRD01-02]|uniref:Uncharacterized protein n=1 Tax=Actinospica acidithermotolerans TaxID=2828514 RepID=A0A941INU9_9ACTN|nr:hypothetical protein [Actinospica acidithermotolerans]MBR7829841.1 hypothetical protein [Actinospica acidithermotolerans]